VADAHVANDQGAVQMNTAIEGTREEDSIGICSRG